MSDVLANLPATGAEAPVLFWIIAGAVVLLGVGAVVFAAVRRRGRRDTL